jgi:hypothetical protein
MSSVALALDALGDERCASAALQNTNSSKKRRLSYWSHANARCQPAPVVRIRPNSKTNLHPLDRIIRARKRSAIIEVGTKFL